MSDPMQNFNSEAQYISDTSDEYASDNPESSTTNQKKRKFTGGKKDEVWNDVIKENYPEVILNTNVFDLLQNEEFYSKCCQIAFILKPIKELTNILEAPNTNLAECFIGLIRLATEALNQIYKTASVIWYNFKYPESSCLSLLSEMRAWKRNEAPYNLSYNQQEETPMKWWLTNELRLYGKDISEKELKENLNNFVNIQQPDNLEIAEESNDDIQQILTNNLNINRIIDLSLPEFLSTNNILFESAINRLSSYERGYNSENREYDPIDLAQQIIEVENNELDI
ncbi:10887_t:CDS:2 [Racocetra fulgida]|uniref:10887_t:CDS:1 n=1 Tax=Racocetra fulgida TaxID=60492 RepID=A0A9N8VHE4_9GLOM|nr:10887_t:CDS:2 [Racocetra fulgida]